MPIFREFWGWIVFVGLASASLIVVIFTVPAKGSFWEILIAAGHKVEPLWVGSAILAYTITEGYTMLADSFRRKMFNAGKAEERKAFLRVLDANPDKSAAEIRRILEGSSPAAGSTSDVPKGP